MKLFYILLFIVSCCFSFYGGVLLGIKDCKRRFMIPKGATSALADGRYLYN